MYCSEECLGKDDQEFHRFVCKQQVLPEDILTDHVLLRILLRCLRVFDGSVQDLKKFVNDGIGKKHTVFDFDWNNADEKTIFKYWLLACLPKRYTSFDWAMQLGALRELIQLEPELQILWKQHSNDLEKIMKTFISMMPILFGKEVYASKKLSLDEDASSFVLSSGDNRMPFPPQNVGASSEVNVDPYYSLLNHSCLPTITTSYIGNKCIWIVVKPTAAGEEIFTNYHTTFDTTQKHHRMKSLKSTFRFKCDCVACDKNWPLMSGLTKIDPNFDLNYYVAMMSKPKMVKLEEAQQGLEAACKFINQHIDNLPCQELAAYMRRIGIEMTAMSRPADFYP